MPHFHYTVCGHVIEGPSATGTDQRLPGMCPACTLRDQQEYDRDAGIYRIKAMSLWQPWATAIFLDVKHYETRPRQLGCRKGDLVAIYATKSYPTEVREWWLSAESQLCRTDMRDKMGRLPEIEHLPRGRILGYCEITGIYRSEDIRRKLPDEELRWGDYRPERTIYGLRIVYQYEAPLEANATQQGLWPTTVDRSLPGVAEWIKAREAQEEFERKGLGL